MNNILRYIAQAAGLMIRLLITLIFGAIMLIATLVTLPIYLCTPRKKTSGSVFDNLKY